MQEKLRGAAVEAEVSVAASRVAPAVAEAWAGEADLGADRVVAAQVVGQERAAAGVAAPVEVTEAGRVARAVEAEPVVPEEVVVAELEGAQALAGVGGQVDLVEDLAAVAAE